MRRSAACVVVLCAVILTAGASSQSPSRTAKIDIKATISDVRVSGETAATGARRVVFLQLWTKAYQGLPIGHGFLACEFLGEQGAFGAGISQCAATYKLPRGYLTAFGVRHSSHRYTLAITGGTGLYGGAGGTLVTTRAGTGQLRLVFLLS